MLTGGWQRWQLIITITKKNIHLKMINGVDCDVLTLSEKPCLNPQWKGRGGGRQTDWSNVIKCCMLYTHLRKAIHWNLFQQTNKTKGHDRDNALGDITFSLLSPPFTSSLVCTCLPPQRSSSCLSPQRSSSCLPPQCSSSRLPQQCSSSCLHPSPG